MSRNGRFKEDEQYIKIQVPFKSSKIATSFEHLIDLCAYSEY